MGATEEFRKRQPGRELSLHDLTLSLPRSDHYRLIYGKLREARNLARSMGLDAGLDGELTAAMITANQRRRTALEEERG